MTDRAILELASIIMAGVTVGIGAVGPAFGEARTAAQALDAIARQPDRIDAISRTLFVSLAMIESLAIYCLVVALILLFANPFTSAAGG